MDSRTLQIENDDFAGSRGVSKNNSQFGFRPAFLDRKTGRVELARLKDGSPAMMHTIRWLPADWAETRNTDGSILSLRTGIISGFVNGGAFYTREEAAEL